MALNGNKALQSLKKPYNRLALQSFVGLHPKMEEDELSRDWNERAAFGIGPVEYRWLQLLAFSGKTLAAMKINAMKQESWSPMHHT
jgi:hypothetical protein